MPCQKATRPGISAAARLGSGWYRAASGSVRPSTPRVRWEAVPLHGQRVCVDDGRSTSSRTDERGKQALPSTVTTSSDSATTVPFHLAVVVPGSSSAGRLRGSPPGLPQA